MVADLYQLDPDDRIRILLTKDSVKIVVGRIDHGLVNYSTPFKSDSNLRCILFARTF